MRLRPLDSLIAPCLAQRPDLPVLHMAPEAAIGRLAASAIRASGPVPPESIALRAGLALRAEDVVGAGPQSPVLVMDRPPALVPGDVLPRGTDALLDPDSVQDQGAFLEITDSAAPGLNIRRRGEDLAEGQVILPAGGRVTPAHALAARMAELETLPVFDLTASLDGFDPVLAALLAALLEECGIRIGTGGMALFRLEPARETTPRLALQPGETGWLEPVEGGIRLEIPPRFDGALAMVLAVLLPILCHWTGARPFPQAGTLARKISAGLGSTSIALLAENAGQLTPLGIGEITLASWLASAGYCVLPPGIEGFAAGATLAAHRLAPLLA